MKKKLTQAQQDVLALAIVQPGYTVEAGGLLAVACLVLGGYASADTGRARGMPITVLATNKGVRTAVRGGFVVQDGTRFRLPEGSTLELQDLPNPAQPGTTVVTNAGLRLVPPKPRDPFDEGFTAAKDGQPASNTWQGQTEVSEYDEGFRQGAMWRVQNPPAASA